MIDLQERKADEGIIVSFYFDTEQERNRNSEYKNVYLLQCIMIPLENEFTSY